MMSEGIMEAMKALNNIKLALIIIFSLVFISYAGLALQGKTLKQMSTNQVDIDEIVFAPDYSTSGTLLVVGEEGGIFRSANRGKSWTQRNSGLVNLVPGFVYHGLAISPSFANDKTLLITSSYTGIYRSRNASLSWKKIASNKMDIYEAVFSPNYLNDKIIYGVALDGIYKSINGGLSWFRIKAEGYGLVVSPNFLNDNLIFSYGGSGLYKSQDGGQNWSEIVSGSIKSVVISPDFISDNTILYSNDKSLFKSTDKGQTFSQIGNNFPHTGNNTIFLPKNFGSDNTLFIHVSDAYDWWTYKTTNGGLTWTLISDAQTFAISPDYSNDKTVFAYLYNKQLFKSTDGGDTWVTTSGLTKKRTKLVMAIKPRLIKANQTVTVLGRLSDAKNKGLTRQMVDFTIYNYGHASINTNKYGRFKLKLKFKFKETTTIYAEFPGSLKYYRSVKKVKIIVRK